MGLQFAPWVLFFFVYVTAAYNVSIIADDSWQDDEGFNVTLDVAPGVISEIQDSITAQVYRIGSDFIMPLLEYLTGIVEYNTDVTRNLSA